MLTAHFVAGASRRLPEGLRPSTFAVRRAPAERLLVRLPAGDPGGDPWGVLGGDLEEVVYLVVLERFAGVLGGRLLFGLFLGLAGAFEELLDPTGSLDAREQH